MTIESSTPAQTRTQLDFDLDSKMLIENFASSMTIKMFNFKIQFEIRMFLPGLDLQCRYRWLVLDIHSSWASCKNVFTNLSTADVDCDDFYTTLV